MPLTQTSLSTPEITNERALKPTSALSARQPHLVDVTMFWSATGGGVRRYLETKQHWLRQQGQWQHSIVVPLAKQNMQPDPHGAGAATTIALPSWPLPLSKGYRFTYSRSQSLQRLLQLQPDLIEAGDPYNLAWDALKAAHQLHIPAVTFAHTDLVALASRGGSGLVPRGKFHIASRLSSQLGKLAGTAAQKYRRYLYNHFDLVLAPSQQLAQQLAAELNTTVVHQPLGVDTQVFKPCSDAARQCWRQRLGLHADSRLAIFAGRFAAEKNLPVLMQAIKQLGQEWTLILMGDGPALPPGQYYRVQRANDGMQAEVTERNVIVLPFERVPEHIAQALAACDVFVHAGDIETFGLSALEAMACGTPVVACARAGLSEIVDNQVGLALARGTADEFAQALHALRDADTRAPLAQAARQRSLQYGWPTIFTRLTQHYQRLLGLPLLTASDNGFKQNMSTSTSARASAHG